MTLSYLAGILVTFYCVGMAGVLMVIIYNVAVGDLSLWQRALGIIICVCIAVPALMIVMLLVWGY